MNETVAATGEGVTAETPQRIRLSILHLALWTAGAACMLSLTQRPPGSATGEPITIYFLVYQSLTAVVLGWAISCLALPFLPGSRRQFPSAPGHWLLIVLGVGALISLASTWLHVLLVPLFVAPGTEPSTGIIIFFASRGIGGVAGCLLFVMVCLQCRQWRLFFAFMATTELLSAGCYLVVCLAAAVQPPGKLFAMASTPPSCLLLIGNVVLLSMVGADLVNKVKRDWLHWTGVGVLLFEGVMYLVTSVAMRFLL